MERPLLGHDATLEKSMARCVGGQLIGAGHAVHQRPAIRDQISVR